MTSIDSVLRKSLPSHATPVAAVPQYQPTIRPAITPINDKYQQIIAVATIHEPGVRSRNISA
jgi:hypothetical protein